MSLFVPSAVCAADRRRPNRRQLRVERQRFGIVPVQRCRHLGTAARPGRLQVAGDGVAEQRMRADFDEGGMVFRSGRHSLAEPHRITQIDHPVVGIERRRRAVGLTDRADQRDLRRNRRQTRQRTTQLGQDRVNRGMVRGHVHFDAPRQPALRIHHRDHRVHLLGRPRDHRLLRSGIHRHSDIRVVRDQLLDRLGLQLQQRHRALPRQPRHQLRPRRDHLQTIGRAQRPGHHAPRSPPPSNAQSPHPVPRHTSATTRSTPTAYPPTPAGYARYPPPAHRQPARPAAKTRPAQRIPAPTRPPPRRTPAHRSNNCRPMPAHCEP